MYLCLFLLISIGRRKRKINSNIDTKQNPIKFTIPEHSTKHDFSTSQRTSKTIKPESEIIGRIQMKLVHRLFGLNVESV